MRTCCAIGTWALTWTVLVAAVVAQGQRGPAPPTESLTGDVTVMTVMPRALQVTTSNLEQWVVSIPTGPEDVVFRGPATAQFLQPGMAVRFHTAFRRSDKRQKEYQATRPVSKLEIISLLPASQPGLYSDDVEDADDGASEDADDDKDDAKKEPQAKKEPPAEKELPAKKEKVKKKEDADDDEEGAAAGADFPCLVIGILKEYKNNKIKVQAGPFPVTADLPETAKVSVDVRHCLWVHPGDKIELVARFYTGMRGRAEGQRMTITAAVPLAPDEKATKGRRRTRDKKQDDAPKKVDAKGESR